MAVLDTLGKPFFGSRQLKVAEMDRRASKKRETAGKRSAGDADDQDFQKSPAQKKRNFRPPQNERAG